MRLFELLKGKAPKEHQNMYWSLQEYCQAFIDRPVNVAERVIWLNEEQSREFYMYIPRGGIETDLETFRNDEDKERLCYGYKLRKREHSQKKWLGDFSPLARGGAFEMRGVYYVMDEFHKLFGSREWQSAGPQLEDFMSEIRKINGDLLILTQHPEKVDKNCRRNATEWYQFVNRSKQSTWMGVTFKKSFKFHHYEQPEMPSRTDKPTRSGKYRIDTSRRYEFLYRTMYGSSIKGGSDVMVAEEQMRKGWHWSVWIIPFLIAGALAILVPPYLIRGFGHVVGSTVNQGMSGVQTSVSPNLVPPPAPGGRLPQAVNAAPGPVAVPPAPRITWQINKPSHTMPARGRESENLAGNELDYTPADDVYCTGWFRTETNIIVTLSDGMIARSERGEVQGVGERFVRVFNLPRKIPLHY